MDCSARFGEGIFPLNTDRQLSTQLDEAVLGIGIPEELPRNFFDDVRVGYFGGQ